MIGQYSSSKRQMPTVCCKLCVWLSISYACGFNFTYVIRETGVDGKFI